MQFVKHSTNKRIVSLTPLIDVVFILLIFFMLVSQFSQWSHIDVSTPAPSTNQQNQLNGTLLVRISETGNLDVAGTPTNLNGLVTLINRSLSENPEQVVLVKPAEKLPIQDLIKILDLLKQTGITNFSIIR